MKQKTIKLIFEPDTTTLMVGVIEAAVNAFCESVGVGVTIIVADEELSEGCDDEEK
jgi:hypothetical protein